MGLHNLIANGGKVVVIGGRMNDNWRQFTDNPQFIFWTGDRAEIDRHFPRGGGELPSNTRGVIVSKFISHATAGRIIEEARKKKALIMGPKNDGEVTRLLEEILTPEKTKETSVPEQQVAAPIKELRAVRRGELAQYAKKYDESTKPIAEVAKKVFAIIQADGIMTTENSVAQSIGKMRRDAGVFAKPDISASMKKMHAARRKVAGETETIVAPAKSTKKMTAKEAETETELLLKMIDDLLAGLTLLKDAVTRMHEHDLEYRSLQAKLAELGFLKK